MGHNPYAPPQSPAGPDIRPPSKVGIWHFVLIGVTVMLFLYGAGLVPLLWKLMRAGALSPMIGILFSLAAISLAAGVWRSNYRPWLGRWCFSAAFANSATLIGLLFVESIYRPLGRAGLWLFFALFLAALIALAGAIMSMRAVK